MRPVIKRTAYKDTFWDWWNVKEQSFANNDYVWKQVSVEIEHRVSYVVWDSIRMELVGEIFDASIQ